MVGLGRVRLLEVDPELGAALDAATFERALRCTAGLTALAEAPYWVPRDGGLDDFGLLILRGVLLERCQVVDRDTVDLVGPGDVIRPWPSFDDWTALALRRWRVLDPVQFAVLDRPFLAEASDSPELLVALAERAARHVRSFRIRLAIAQIPQVSERVELMMWQLAYRFGKVDRTGVLIPLRLTHGTLADLVGARREVVSRRLKGLAERGLVMPDPRGWRLGGTPRDESGDSKLLPVRAGAVGPAGNGL